MNPAPRPRVAPDENLRNMSSLALRGWRLTLKRSFPRWNHNLIIIPRHPPFFVGTRHDERTGACSARRKKNLPRMRDIRGAMSLPTREDL